MQIDTRSPALIQRDAYTRQAAAARTPRLTLHNPAPTDTLQLSAEATDAAASETTLRDGLVQRIRSEIEAGRYLTDEKLEIAAEQLYREIRTSRR